MIGKKLGNRYECLERIGGGGMAVVYKAKDILLDRLVAVKILRPQYAVDDDFVRRFRREGQAAASLSHHNIVSIYDVGVEDEDIHYIVMEYVEGTTLKEYINQYGPLPVEEAIYITRQIAEALDHAHQNHIIHRDIKPHNILIGKRSRKIKVTDFGIARAVTSATITQTGSVIGSVHYFSPEQARGGITGEKSDLYSLGVVLYEMLTGQLPFSGDSPISVALKHLQENFVEPREINPDLPQSVENIVMRSLLKEPSRRYSSARELIKDLDTCLNSSRLMEEKFHTQPIDDEEATKVMPTIGSDLVDTKVIQAASTTSKSAEQEEDDEDEDEELEEEKKPRSKKALWTKIGIISLVILILGFTAYQGFKFISILFTPEEIILENVEGLPYEDAVRILTDQGVQIGTTSERISDTVEEGHIISQTPIAGASVRKNSYVSLTKSVGRERTQMPTVENLSQSAAERLLSQNGFEDIVIEKIYHDDIAMGIVISQEPAAEEWVISDETSVKLVVSEGRRVFEMPDLIGKRSTEATSILLEHNLVLDEIKRELSDVAEGQVFRQHPVDPGQEVAEGTPITIWVSDGYIEQEREKTVEISVAPPEPNDSEERPETKVTIIVQDVNGQRRFIENEIIHEPKSYQVNLTVSRDRNAFIYIIQDGEPHPEISVGFDD